MKGWLSSVDLEKSAFLLAGAGLAAFLPERYWPISARAIANVAGAFLRGRDVQPGLDMPRPLLEAGGATSDAAVNASFRAGHLVEAAQLMRLRLPGGWKPVLVLNGAGIIDQALDGGKGAILWPAGSHSSNLVVKMAFAAHGYRVSHLSRPGHPFSETAFGRSILNPIQTRVEDRYLARRLVFGDKTWREALRQLRSILAANGLVSITLGDQALQTVEAPFFGGCLQFASGPISLSATTGAPLLPTFCVCRSAGVYEVRIEGPILVERGASRAGEAAAAEQYAALLEKYVRNHPGQWYGLQHAMHWRPE